MRPDLREWIALSLTSGVGPVIARKILERFGYPGAFFRATRSQLDGLGLREETFNELASGSPLEEAEKQLLFLEKHSATALTLEDEDYPEHLRKIYDPPIVLYFRGDLKETLEQPCVAIVGSRQCSTYGRNAATKLARDLAAHNVTVVSGLARGIDTSAHEGALEARGLTVAVMGTGLDEIYPKENAKLAERIVEQGALVTEFPMQKPPLPQNFPYRNRVISGFSLGVVVVEASERSGSLITARLAMEQDREVYAVPGNITSGKSIGPNRLIQDGAKLVMDWQDVVAEFSYDLRRQLQLGTQPSSDAEDRPLFQRELETALTENERRVFQFISLDQPVHIDQLLVESGMSSPELLTVLLGLEMKDRVRQLPGKNYVRKL